MHTLYRGVDSFLEVGGLTTVRAKFLQLNSEELIMLEPVYSSCKSHQTTHSSFNSTECDYGLQVAKELDKQYSVQNRLGTYVIRVLLVCY